jgi:hypothetical protein
VKTVNLQYTGKMLNYEIYKALEPQTGQVKALQAVTTADFQALETG